MLIGVGFVVFVYLKWMFMFKSISKDMCVIGVMFEKIIKEIKLCICLDFKIICYYFEKLE